MKQFIKDCTPYWLGGFAGGFFLGCVICMMCYVTTC